MSSFDEELARRRAERRAPQLAQEVARQASEAALETGRADAAVRASAMLPEVEKAVRALQATGQRRRWEVTTVEGRLVSVAGFMDKPRVWVGKPKGWSLGSIIVQGVVRGSFPERSAKVTFPGFLQVPFTGDPLFHLDAPLSLADLAGKGSVLAEYEFIELPTRASRSDYVQLEVADYFSGVVRFLASSLAGLG
jgi:hypothetical protein